MKLPFVSRRQHESEIAKVEDKRRRLARWLAEADATNRRLAGRNLELGVRLSDYAESDPDYLASLERRIACLQKGVARYLPALWQSRAEVASLTDLAVQANKQLDRTEERVRAAREEGRREARTVSADEREKAPLDGAASSARLKRAEERCRALDARITELQASHVADTRELHDLRQNGGVS